MSFRMMVLLVSLVVLLAQPAPASHTDVASAEALLGYTATVESADMTDLVVNPPGIVDVVKSDRGIEFKCLKPGEVRIQFKLADRNGQVHNYVRLIKCIKEKD